MNRIPNRLMRAYLVTAGAVCMFYVGYGWTSAGGKIPGL